MNHSIAGRTDEVLGNPTELDAVLNLLDSVCFSWVDSGSDCFETPRHRDTQRTMAMRARQQQRRIPWLGL